MDGPKSRWRESIEPALDRNGLSSPSPSFTNFSSSLVFGLGPDVCKLSGQRFGDAGSDECRDTVLSSRCSLGGLGGGERDGDVGGNWAVVGAVGTSAVAVAAEVTAGSVSACTPPMIGSDRAFFSRGELSLAGTG